MTADDKKRVFYRMGRELTALRELLGNILCDTEYQSVMPKVEWCRISQMIDRLSKLRNDAENRMVRTIPDCDVHAFYPHDRDDLYEAIDKFRSSMREGDITD